MVQPPDEYSMKRKFLKGLPEDLIENLLKSRRVSAEHTSLTTLLREVKAMDSSLQAFQNYKSDCAERPTTPRNTSNSNSHNASNNPTPRVIWFVKRKQGSYPFPVTEGQLHEAVVITLETALAVVIIISVIEGYSHQWRPALVVIIIMFRAHLLGAPRIEWNHTKWFASDVVKRATCRSIALTPHGCSRWCTYDSLELK